MAPRNNDPSTSYKRNCPAEDTDIRDLLPCLLHKKHKVVKLVKSQIQNIRKDGFICDLPQFEAEDVGNEEILTMRNLDTTAALMKAIEQAGGRGEEGGRRGEQGRGRGEQREGRGEYGDGRMGQGGGINNSTATGNRGRRSLCGYLTLFLLEFLLLIFLMVYISAGPLSNTIVHTPVPPGSFVRTERPCFLEKKYLLRWSRPELLE